MGGRIVGLYLLQALKQCGQIVLRRGGYAAGLDTERNLHRYNGEATAEALTFGGIKQSQSEG